MIVTDGGSNDWIFSERRAGRERERLHCSGEREGVVSQWKWECFEVREREKWLSVMVGTWSGWWLWGEKRNKKIKEKKIDLRVQNSLKSLLVLCLKCHYYWM
jgi:hypothetical protein